MAEILILGGGFGGLAAAHELEAALPDARVTLVANRTSFYMGFAKLWDLAGFRPLTGGTVELARLKDRGVRFLRAEVSAMDLKQRTISTSEGTLGADAILIALGADAKPAHLDLLAGDRAYDLYDGAQLAEIHRALDEVESGMVLISILGMPIKCPPAPFEAALVVDEVLRRRGVRDDVGVAISTPAPMTLPVAGAGASEFVARHLMERGVQLLTEHALAEVDSGGRVARFGGGDQLEYSVLLGVPASVAPPVVTGVPGLAGPSGWIEPDPRTLRTSFDRVYAAGDCTAIPAGKGQLPKAGVFAAAEGRVAARNIAADLTGSPPAEFDGRGFCFLELPGQNVAYVEGDWYAPGGPQVQLTAADRRSFERKQAYEHELLEQWFKGS
ncbi:MAG TPA: FAD/NAD(P)-binding oxidoreductase [Actinomycetota bacterium]|nr:FAD/NAD(P)-binding oxidoreductase [Actinomycetota bacterium]